MRPATMTTEEMLCAHPTAPGEECAICKNKARAAAKDPAPMPLWHKIQFELLLGKFSDWRNADHEDALALCRSDVIAIIEGVRDLKGLSAQADVRAGTILKELSDWCEKARYEIGAVDGYDYRSGEEFGIRRVELQIEKMLRALASQEKQS